MFLAVFVALSLTQTADAGEDLELEELIDTEILTSIGRIKQRTSDVAGALTVLRGEELRQRGYTSLAQALKQVPGLYSVTDLTTISLGVRGVAGGSGSAGTLMKLLIDGNPVSFRPTNGNFLGEELISLDAVERIEVLRSPSSALFGANAFLGVINIVTRSAERLRTGALVTGSAGALRDRFQVGGTVTVSGAVGDVEALLSFQQFRVDRSGLALPSSSPALSREGAAPAAPMSTNDISNPQSLFGRLSVANFAGGRLSLVVTHQRLDVGNQFLGFAPLRARSRLTLLNDSLRVQDERFLGPRVELRTAVSLQRSRWEPTTVIDLGNEGELARANGGSTGFEISSEASIRITDDATIAIGADFSRDVHEVLGYSTLRTEPLVRSDGSVVLPVGSDSRTDAPDLRVLWNGGGWVQGVAKLVRLLSATAGVRLDGHNIYGLQVSPRAGLVFSAQGFPWTVKLLYGSAFKPPSAVELYGRPLTTFDLQGNPELKPQYARTVELVGSYRIPLLLELRVSLFATAIDQIVRYVQTSRFLEANNAPARWYLGGEAEFEWAPHKTFRFKATLGWVQPRTVAPASSDSVLAAAMPIFPALQGHLSADWAVPFLSGAHLAAEFSAVGPRLASETNSIERFQGYSLPAYGVLSLSAALLDRKWVAGRNTSLRLRVDNVLDTRFADPGVGGVDLPAVGRSVLLSLTQEL